MPRTIKCRHCGGVVNPLPGKPGYADECLRCFHEQNPTQQPSQKPKYYKPAIKPTDQIDRDLETLTRKINRARKGSGRPTID